jgi:hypothetical protein
MPPRDALCLQFANVSATTAGSARAVRSEAFTSPRRSPRRRS